MGVPIDDNIVIRGEQKFELDGGGGFNPDSLSDSTNTPADADNIITSESGTWYKKAFSKVWDYIKTKIGISAQGSANKFLNEQGTFTVVNSGKEYDLEFNADLDEVTLTEDDVDKTTLPLVATFIGSHNRWNALTPAQQSKYRHVIFNDDGGFGNAYDVPYRNSNVGDAIDNLSTIKANKTAIENLKDDATGILIDGNDTTNTTGSTITKGKYFYYGDALVKAKADIANGATLTLNTNFELVTDGALNELRDTLDDKVDNGLSTTAKQTYSFPTSASAVSNNNDKVTILKNGFAIFTVSFSSMTYSQIVILVNGAVIAYPTSGNANLVSHRTIVTFPVKKGDVVSVSFYSTYTVAQADLAIR